MKIINDKVLLEKYVKKYSIRDYFDTKDLDFKLIEFKKGSFLTRPLEKMEYMFFYCERLYKDTKFGRERNDAHSRSVK